MVVLPQNTERIRAYNLHEDGSSFCFYFVFCFKKGLNIQYRSVENIDAFECKYIAARVDAAFEFYITSRGPQGKMSVGKRLSRNGRLEALVSAH